MDEARLHHVPGNGQTSRQRLLLLLGVWQTLGVLFLLGNWQTLRLLFVLGFCEAVSVLFLLGVGQTLRMLLLLGSGKRQRHVLILQRVRLRRTTCQRTHSVHSPHRRKRFVLRRNKRPHRSPQDRFRQRLLPKRRHLRSLTLPLAPRRRTVCTRPPNPLSRHPLGRRKRLLLRPTKSSNGESQNRPCQRLLPQGRHLRSWPLSKQSAKMTRPWKTLLISLVLALAPFSTVGFAHSGGTDARGGHFNRRTGEYHFHHGMGPHQHPGGVCPYDRTRSNSSTRKSNAPWYLGIAALAGVVAWANRKKVAK